MKYLKIPFYFFLITSIFTFNACGEDPVTPTVDDPIASFQFEISESNYLEVTFSNFSQNASSYNWDFGDGNSATDENPIHTYAAAGDYDVVLTASNSSGDHSITKTVTIADPNAEIKKITGETSKVWKLSRNVAEEEYPLIVGPEDHSQIWWAYGLNDPIGARPCLMEEEYIFNVDGSFTYDTKGYVFADYGIWNADVEGNCVDETDSGSMINVDGVDISAWGSGTHSFTYDASSGELTVTGLGAHVGLPKVATNGEVNTPQEFVTYTVTKLETEGAIDKMTVETYFDGGYWQFNLVSYDNPADEPDLPGAPPTAAFDYSVDARTVTFTNNSVNADSYDWDFGDGNSATDENPVHTYAEDGSYTVTLTATNSDGSTPVSANIIISTGATFSASVLHGDGDKTWTLSPIAGAMAVGPAMGSSEWWANSEEDITTRACAFDDTYNFNMDGTFTYTTNGDVWGEAYMGVDPAGCVDESALSTDAAAWGSGTHSFTIAEGDPAYVTVTGTGAFIGIPKAFNGGEYAAGPPATDGSVTYRVLNYINDGTTETLILTIDISDGETGGAWWTVTLVSQ